MPRIFTRNDYTRTKNIYKEGLYEEVKKCTTKNGGGRGTQLFTNCLQLFGNAKSKMHLKDTGHTI